MTSTDVTFSGQINETYTSLITVSNCFDAINSINKVVRKVLNFKLKLVSLC